MTDNLDSSRLQLRIIVTAEVPDDPGQHYTAVEMLLALANGLSLRGVTPSLLRLEINPPHHPRPDPGPYHAHLPPEPVAY